MRVTGLESGYGTVADLKEGPASHHPTGRITFPLVLLSTMLPRLRDLRVKAAQLSGKTTGFSHADVDRIKSLSIHNLGNPHDVTSPRHRDVYPVGLL